MSAALSRSTRFLLFSLSGPPVEESQFALTEQDTSLCLFHQSGLLIFHSKNNRFEGAAGVLSVRTPLYTTSKRATAPRASPLPHAHYHHLLRNTVTVSLKHLQPQKTCAALIEGEELFFFFFFFYLTLGMDSSLNFVGNSPLCTTIVL